jgi:hypothetical protein
VVRAGLRQLEAHESAGRVFPEGSLVHCYTEPENRRELRLARSIRVPEPDEALP